MNIHKITSQLMAFTLLTLLVAFSAMAADYEQEFNVAAGGKLNVKIESGSIKIQTHNTATALVEARITGRDSDDFSINSDLKGNSLKVRGELEGRSWNRDLKVELTITIPKEFDIEVDTSGGSIEISDLNGNVIAHTSGGSINVGTIKGDVRLDTAGGSIRTEDVYGSLNAHTSGGSIRVTFAEQLKDDAKLDTSGGSITAYLIEDVKVDLDASTSGGRVKTDFAVTGSVKKRSIRGEINGGGPTLKLRTSGGSVKVLSL
ncbi:DUF4097 family beta strand repeat-containing protein [Psychrosphaera sp. 1_MG-2023]|uniref:DUF4097 family beta strand repeat-containing protein n=1 Tax=Psychrosphaera sp. 1_MG-2023 TaxID=3062643 RepID=UPI0026E2B1DA|nr:DUF4097 family beta strand repeat-containing protein [Psychrosphaera sp. 1_MG-2023]MDO6720358.1 DUF4097 family beta strand repeat-containing protein [Psychrosphaera sp. 1_MG-2023]